MISLPHQIAIWVTHVLTSYHLITLRGNLNIVKWYIEFKRWKDIFIGDMSISSDIIIIINNPVKGIKNNWHICFLFLFHMHHELCKAQIFLRIYIFLIKKKCIFLIWQIVRHGSTVNYYNYHPIITINCDNFTKSS